MASIVGCAISLYKVAQSNRTFFLHLYYLEISNIWSFIFTPLSDKTNMRTRGLMWMILLIYTFFVVSGIIGVINAFPKIRKALDRKPKFGNFHSFPSQTLHYT